VFLISCVNIKRLGTQAQHTIYPRISTADIAFQQRSEHIKAYICEVIRAKLLYLSVSVSDGTVWLSILDYSD